MATEVFKGRYTDLHTVARELRACFAAGAVIQVIYERGRFFCTVPKKLTQDERYKVEKALEADHYADEEDSDEDGVDYLKG